MISQLQISGNTMEHVGPLTVSLQKALVANHMESELYFVSAILSTLIRVLDEKSGENKYVEESEIQQYQAILDNKVFEDESKLMNTGEVIETIPDDKTFKIPPMQEQDNSLLIKVDQFKECGSQEDVNSCEERTLTGAEKRYILETVSKSIQNQIVKCELCDFSPTTNNRKTQELRMHNLKVHFMCTLCGSQHSKESDLRKHMEGTHRGGINHFICNIDGCSHREKTLSRLGDVQLKFRSLYVHIRRRHSEYKCNLCETKSATESALKIHLANEHNTGKITKFHCPHCGKVFNIAKNMRAHVNSTVHKVLPPQNCQLCKFATKYPKQLKRHVMIVHEEEVLKCDHCSFKAKHAATMEKHKESDHMRKGGFKCGVCSYETNKGRYLARHNLTHSEVKSYICGTCDFRTKTPHALETHEKYHKPPQYICDSCEYTSHNGANFSTHKKVKHGNAQHKCRTCEKMFMFKRYLVKHEKKHI